LIIMRPRIMDISRAELPGDRDKYRQVK